MHETLLAILRCPACGGTFRFTPLEASHGQLACGAAHVFLVEDGVPRLVYPPGQAYLNEDPDAYDRGIAFMTRLLNTSEPEVRRTLVDLLHVAPGASVLEVACGPGPNLPYVLDAIGPAGQVCAFDISPGMIGAARRRVADDARTSFVLGNGCHLPFADATFDAVLHAGTLLRFSDIPGALAEMARVVKPGGRVVAADEGVAPWHAETEYGQTLARFGTLFQGTPPMEALPARARDVALRWIAGDAFFAIDFRVADRPPELNLDVPLPGRTETVRQVLDAAAARES
jgi:SAM-dependent methyltransferase